MKFLLSWLKEYIDVNESSAELAKILTSLGLEVDAITAQGIGFEGVVVARVIDVHKHPNADKLCIATVNDGQTDFQVVCGAKNCRKGILTAFAKVDAKLRGADGTSFLIKKTKIRDIESHGMLCAEDELQLGEQSEGIIEFSPQVKEGTDVAHMYADTLFEISLTPNLGHCMSLLGIAGELSAALQRPLKIPLANLKEELSSHVEQKVTLSVEDPNKALRYACRVVEGCTVTHSPQWMQLRLTAAGVRPINLVVDITNYILLETGQPLHAFDLDKIEDKHVCVRCAKDGETLITLDNQERKLTAQDLVICQGKEISTPIALAGVMGGHNSEVDEKTQNVLIESAHFSPSAIRYTSKRLGLQTDASRRFERHSDPNNVLYALDRAALLMQILGGGRVCQGVIDRALQEFCDKEISCRLSRINALLGTLLGAGEVENIFSRLRFKHQWDGKDVFFVFVPTSRADIKEEIDLIEEVARIYGYENIPKVVPKFHASTIPPTPMYLFENSVRTRMLAEGMQELLTCDLIGPTILNIVGDQIMPKEALIQVLNPTSIEQSILRTSLLPGLLQVAKYNYDHENHNFCGFEIGRIHFKDQKQYKEQSVLGIIMMGKTRPHHWDIKPKESDFYDLKGLIENLLDTLGFTSPTSKVQALPFFHTGRQLSFVLEGLEIGSMGEVHPSIVHRLDLPQRLYFAEINLYDLYQLKKGEALVEELAVFPASKRDWTVTLRQDQPIEEIIRKMQAIPSALLEKVFLQDLYESDKLGPNKRNATFHFVYRDKEKTIAQSEVDSEHARILQETSQFIRQ